MSRIFEIDVGILLTEIFFPYVNGTLWCFLDNFQKCIKTIDFVNVLQYIGTQIALSKYYSNAQSVLHICIHRYIILNPNPLNLILILKHFYFCVCACVFVCFL